MKMLASTTCMNMGLALLGGLGVRFSDGHNSMYGLPDMYRMLISMCDGKREGATAEGRYRDSLHHGKVRLPSRSWLYKKIGNVRHDYMLKRCKIMIRSTVYRAKRRGMLRGKISVAIDEHDIPFHAKCMNLLYTVCSKGKKGTTRFNRIVTIFCVVKGQHITLGVEVATRDDTTADIVERLLKQCRECGIDIEDVITDRGYYSTDVFRVIRTSGYNALMPAVKHNNIKELIRDYDQGKLPAISEHTISSGNKSETFTLIIIKKPDKKKKMSKEDQALAKLYEKQACVEDKYYVFATTISAFRINGDPKYIADLYRKRWGIENSYKSYEQLRPWTTSNNYSVRILLWFLPFVLCNIWMIARFITCKQTGECTRSPYALYLFVSCILTELDAIARSGRPPD